MCDVVCTIHAVWKQPRDLIHLATQERNATLHHYVFIIIPFNVMWFGNDLEIENTSPHSKGCNFALCFHYFSIQCVACQFCTRNVG